MLNKEGCNEFQGYYFGRPMTIEALLDRPAYRAAS